jgi:hypothetical protein
VVSVTDPAGQPAAPVSPWINEDATRLYFEGNSGTPKLYQAPFNGVGYGPAEAIGFDADDRGPVLSRDEMRIYFGSARPHPGGASGATFLVYTSTRSSIDAPFGPPQFVTELNEGAAEMRPSWLSADACTILLFGRLEGGTNDTDVFVATKPAF